MIKVRQITDSEISQWEQYVEQNPTIAWQSYHWSTVVKKHYKADFFPLAAFESSQICGILPLYQIKTIKGKNHLISVPYAVGGGLYADNIAAEKALLDAAIELHNKLMSHRIVFKQYNHKLDGPLKTDDSFYNKELDLSLGIDALYQNLDPNNKSKIAEGSKLNLDLIYPSNNIDDFYRLLLLHHRNSGVPCVGKQWISDLINFKMYGIALLKCDGKLVAGTLVKEHKKTVSFPFTCLPDTSEQYEMFAYNLYWMLLKKFSIDGKSIFHSGRIPKNNMTNAYRLGWGGDKHLYYYQYYPQNSGASEFDTKRGKKRELVSAIWKKLPLGLTRYIGPKIVRYFP